MTPLVLVPGMMCDARLFTPQIAAFSGQRHLFLASAAGHDSIAAMATSILDAAPARFALCGLSMGGIIAMEMLRQAPDRVDRIALLDTNPLAEKDEVKTRRAPQMEAVRRGDLAAVMQEQVMPNYLSPGHQLPAVLDLCLDMALGLGAQVFLDQSRALMDRRDQCETLRQAAMPALVLCGRDDALCPLERHDLMAGLIPGSTLEVIENAGHLPTLEQPEQTNAALLRWLEA